MEAPRTDVRPFRIPVDDGALEDLQRRLEATRGIGGGGRPGRDPRPMTEPDDFRRSWTV